MPVEAGVDEARRRVDQEAEPPERRLSLEPRDEIVGEPHALQRRAEHELAGMEDERLVRGDLDELRQLLLLELHVDVRVAGVPEDPEEPVDRTSRLDGCMSDASYGSMPIRPASIRRRMARSESTIDADRRPPRPSRAGPRRFGGHRGCLSEVTRSNRPTTTVGPVSMLYPSIDPNERFRARRDAVRRRKRRRARRSPRRCCSSCSRSRRDDARRQERAAARRRPPAASAADVGRRAPGRDAAAAAPVEVRGVHVTGALASLPGKLDEYVALTKPRAEHDRARRQGRGRRDRVRAQRRPARAQDRRRARLLQARARWRGRRTARAST